MFSNKIIFKRREKFFLLFFIYFALPTAYLIGADITSTTLTVSPRGSNIFDFSTITANSSSNASIDTGKMTLVVDMNTNDQKIIATTNVRSSSNIAMIFFFSLNLNFLSSGSHILTASYSNGSEFNGSSDSQQINIEANLDQIPPLSPLNIFPPRQLRGTQKFDECCSTNDLVNILTWKTPNQGNAQAAYRIFRSVNNRNTKLIAEIPSDGKLKFKFKDHQVKEGRIYTYSVVSVDASGDISSPALVTIKTHLYTPSS